MSQFLPHNPFQDRGNFEKSPRTPETIMSSRFYEVLFGVRDLNAIGRDAEAREQSRAERHLSIVPTPTLIETTTPEPKPSVQKLESSVHDGGISKIRAEVMQTYEEQPIISLDEEIRRVA